MPLFEWRKFTFFDLKKGVDNGNIARALKGGKVTVSSNGNNQLVLGDSSGHIYLISRTWDIKSFKAYDLRVHLVQQLRNQSLLVTVGEDEHGVNPIIKVWDVNRYDKSNDPLCCRITRAIPNNRPVQANALCVHENAQFLAVGFTDGSLLLYRGDITRDRGSRTKLLRDGGAPITGLAFKTMATSTLLYVSTDSSVFVYNITHKDKEQKLILDNEVQDIRCSVLAETMQESQFVVAGKKAVYFYTCDGKGPCYAVDGDKVLIEWFRSYLVIFSKSNLPKPVQPNTEIQNAVQQHMITVLDTQNKFIGLSATINEVAAVFSEWGAFYILDCENNVYHLDEKDLQTKMSVLFKKNLYDFAIRIAKSEQYDSDGLADIFQQYGDHLYSKGAHSGAIQQYIKTIDKLEPSYVIRKFVDSQHVELLTTYLQAIHEQGRANEDHTTLLLNCFTKLNKSDSLKQFISTKDRDFNVDVAIKVCRQGSPEEALMLAKSHKKHDWYIKLQIEDHKKYLEVIDYISNLKYKDAEFFMKKYGSILIEHAPHESTQFLKKLCTNYKPNNQPNDNDDIMDVSERADPDDYIHLFLNNSICLVEFLEYLVQEGCNLNPAVYDTLLEHYLHVWHELDVGPEKTNYASKTLKLLQNSDNKYDRPQALVVCHLHGFSEGVLHLYEGQKLYQQILRYHMSRQDTNSVLTCCRRYGQQERSLWVQALFSYIRDSKNPPMDVLPEILTVIGTKELLAPQFVIEAIAMGKSNITLGHVKSYIITQLEKEQEAINSEIELTKNYRKDIEKLKEQLETLKNDTMVIQGYRCAACGHQLELPSIHFLCQHSYHQQCLSYSDSENECLICLPENKKVVELLKASENTKVLHENFHSELEKRSDGFSLAAEYFGRGVFNKVKVVTMEKQVERQVEKQMDTQVPTYGLGAEARIRQVENARSGSSIIPTSEGRMRHEENIRNPSHEPNISYTSRRSEPSKKTAQQFKQNLTPTNPFEVYDDSKNPFEKDNSDDNKNDYDKNFNPFYT